MGHLSGYVSQQLEADMNEEGKRWLLIRPYKTMKKLMTKWQEQLYKGRFKIEFDFRDLKLFHGLVTSLPRSVSVCARFDMGQQQYAPNTN